MNLHCFIFIINISLNYWGTMFRNTKQHYKFISTVPADFTEVLWNVKAKSRNRHNQKNRGCIQMLNWIETLVLSVYLPWRKLPALNQVLSLFILKTQGQLNPFPSVDFWNLNIWIKLVQVLSWKLPQELFFLSL